MFPHKSVPFPSYRIAPSKRCRHYTTNQAGDPPNTSKPSQPQTLQQLLDSRINSLVPKFHKLSNVSSKPAALPPHEGPTVGKKELTAKQLMSISINESLSRANRWMYLSNRTKHANEVIEIYKNFSADLKADNLTYRDIYDMNTFVEFFLRLGRLKNAQVVLSDLLRLQPSLLYGDTIDVPTVRNYLKVNCGADVSAWMRSGNGRGQGRYRVLDETFIYHLIEYSLKTGVNFWDTEICYGLGYMNNVSTMEKFVARRYGTDVGVTRLSNDRTKFQLKGKIVEAIFSSYAYNDRNIVRATDTMNKLFERHRDMTLDEDFWRCVIGWATRYDLVKLKETREKPVNYIECWKSMKTWHERSQRRVPYDYTILEDLYEVIFKTNNLLLALDVYSTCFTKFYEEPKAIISKTDLKLIQKYQNFIVRRLLSKRKSSKAQEFIDEWSIDAENRKKLEDFKAHLIDLKTSKEAARTNAKLQELYDEEDDENGLFMGKVW